MLGVGGVRGRESRVGRLCLILRGKIGRVEVGMGEIRV